MNPTKEDLKNVSEWFSTGVENVLVVETKNEPIKLFINDIIDCLNSYDEFPEDEERTQKIIKDIRSTGEIYPVYVEEKDANHFIMEGRHRMVAFYLLGYTEIPVSYVRNTQPEIKNNLKYK